MKILIYAAQFEMARKFSRLLALPPGTWIPVSSEYNLKGLGPCLLFVLTDTFSGEVDVVTAERREIVFNAIERLEQTNAFAQVLHVSLDKASGVNH